MYEYIRCMYKVVLNIIHVEVAPRTLCSHKFKYLADALAKYCSLEAAFYAKLKPSFQESDVCSVGVLANIELNAHEIKCIIQQKHKI